MTRFERNGSGNDVSDIIHDSPQGIADLRAECETLVQERMALAKERRKLEELLNSEISERERLAETTLDLEQVLRTWRRQRIVDSTLTAIITGLVFSITLVLWPVIQRFF